MVEPGTRPVERWSPVGRYDVGAELARGGMGVIHRAYDRLGQREVAYKRMLVAPGRSRALLTTLFQREYDTLARLPHPNIVTVYDYGMSPEGPYYSMELLSGSELTECAPLAYRDACRVLRDVASALALLHARRLVHRDVNPANVRLTGDGRAKLIDFGGLTAFGPQKEVVGTPAYMAPECLSAEPIDQRCDLYGLGATAYWLLTRRAPVSTKRTDGFPAAWSQWPAAQSLVAPSIPSALADLVRSLLAADPLARPASAAYVSERLTSIAELDAEPDERSVAYSYLARPPLVGRDQPLSHFHDALEALSCGQGSSTLLAGAGGLGRSALLETLSLRAQLMGAVVLSVRAESSGPPFALAHALVETAFSLFPDLEGTMHDSPAGLANDKVDAPTHARSAFEMSARQVAVIESVRTIVLEVSRRVPLVVLVDDVHLLDSGSLALLATLAEDVTHERVLLALSARTDQQPLAELTAYRKLEELTRQVTLTPLTEEQVEQLVQFVFGDDANMRRLSVWIFRSGGGNPATTMDLARLLVQRGLLRYELGSFHLPHELDVSAISADLTSVILARLGDLGPHEMEVTRLLALHDASLQVDQLSSACAHPTRDVVLALEALTRRGIVTSSAEGFALAGATLRAAVSSAIDAADKRALHARLAAVLLREVPRTVERVLSASTHLLRAEDAVEAAACVLSLPTTELLSDEGMRHASRLEEVLAIYRQQGRSEERLLSLLLPIVHAGFYQNLNAQMRQVEEALGLLARVCGLALAIRLRPFLGGFIALCAGLVLGALRRRRTPESERLGTLRALLTHYVALACGAVASATSIFEPEATLRFVAWLEPFSALPRRSSGRLMREFALATADISRGAMRAAAARYARVIPLIARPVRGLHERLRTAIYFGCLNGKGQAEVGDAPLSTLRIADELSHAHPFFATHAETLRASYYWYRGESDKGGTHRGRAERLALRTGLSQSAVTVLTGRFASSAMLTRDPIALAQVIVELDRLALTAPTLHIVKAYCEACLAMVSGREDEGADRFAEVIDRPEARRLPVWRLNYGFYAVALNAAGRSEAAKALCMRWLGDGEPESQRGLAARLLNSQLALAEASLGDLEGARARMTALLASDEVRNNPLELGSAHRECALIAIIAGDVSAFEQHLARMSDAYRATRNTALIQQVDRLIARAVRAGIRHEAEAPLQPYDDALDGSTIVEPYNDVSSTRARRG